jgi:drug/metabolite transporter (DMT)-like permease
MRAADTARLVALAAIWGASFLFTRITAPVLGPVLTAELRTLIAGIALAIWLLGLRREKLEWRRWGRQYLVVGILTSALPFLLWAYSALSLTAGLMSVINATSPMWGALCSAVLLRERLRSKRIIGLAVGVVGVALVTQPQPGTHLPLIAVLAALTAAFCYGLAGAYMKRWANDVPSRGMAVGTQLVAGVILIPVIPLAPPASMPSAFIVACILVLGLLCGAVAYLLYFRLVADLGATGALTVTYLIPVFGVLWGALFLGEALTLPMIAGGVLVLLGTVFVLRT